MALLPVFVLYPVCQSHCRASRLWSIRIELDWINTEGRHLTAIDSPPPRWNVQRQPPRRQVLKLLWWYPITLFNVYSFKPSWSISIRTSRELQWFHGNVIKWKHFPRYWPFVRRIHRFPVNSPHKGQWRGALMSSLIWTGINSWVNNPEAGDLRRHRAHCDVGVCNQMVGY